MPVKLFIADDHAIVRDGLRALLDSSAYQIVGEAEDGLDALERIQKVRPDIAIIDIGLPGLNGIDLTRQLRKQMPRLGLIALSMQTDPARIQAMLQAGADAYIVKGSAFKELEYAISEVMQNRRYISQSLPSEVQDLLHHQKQQTKDTEELSVRELTVLQLIAEGHTSKQIA
ncbi:MAG TPA: response regulator transcription factor, partial [Armatimonadota bacterium]|nr:response regulator transcription factor [Armatimonadota bacterium]